MIQRLLANALFWYLLLVLAFLAFGFYAFQSTYLLQQEEHAQEEQQAREHLETLIEVWESGIFSRANSWFEEVQLSEQPEQLEARWRQNTPWFDALYIWDAERLLYPQTFLTPEAVFPPECEPRENPFFVRDCTPPFSSVHVSNELSLRVGKQLLDDKQPQQALQVLLNWAPPLDTAIANSDPNFSHSTLLTRALLALEYDPKSISLDALAANLLVIDAPSLQELPQLASFPSQDPNLTLVIERTQRRMSAFAEINEHLRRVPLPKELSVHADPYGSRPYLLLSKKQSSEKGSAIQLDPFLLLKELFQQETPKAIRPVILDAQGNLLLGQFSPLQPNEEIWVQLPAGRLFPHLRAAYIRPKEEMQRTGTVSLFFPLILSAVIAGLAIAGSVQAERKQREFIDRQQAFVARVTHELKTPLAGIRLMAESLQLGIVQSPEQAHQFTERIISETDRLEKRIDEVLEGTRRAQLKKKERIDGKKIIEDLYKEWTDRFVEVGGILRIESEGNPELFADKMLLIDALKNLLSNAIKYQREDRPLRCILQVQEKTSAVEFSVSDNGLGVPLMYRKSIFQRFVRVEGPHRGLAGGHGLGLAFVEETAQAHKGTVRCMDGILGGAKFVLRLPKR